MENSCIRGLRKKVSLNNKLPRHSNHRLSNLESSVTDICAHCQRNSFRNLVSDSGRMLKLRTQEDLCQPKIIPIKV